MNDAGLYAVDATDDNNDAHESTDDGENDEHENDLSSYLLSVR